MTTIVVTHEDNEVDQFTFDASDRMISIGRRSTNDVCIPNLSVSGMHARITIDGNSALIEDNSSTNGTYVNGRLISRQLLNEDDEVVIGKSRLVVHLSHVAAQSAQPATAQSGSATHHAEAEDTQPPVLNNTPDFEDDDSFIGDADIPDHDFDANHDQFDERPMSLSEKAKLALGRQNVGRPDAPPQRSGLNGSAAAGTIAAASSATAAASRAFANDSDTAVAELPETNSAVAARSETIQEAEAHPLDGLDNQINDDLAQPIDNDIDNDASTHVAKPAGAVIEIQNGAKSGQVLPIDKPVTTLGRPGIQIAAIMRKPDGYFLMHIESDDSVEMPTLNRDTIGDDPVMLQSGDRLNVAGIDVEFMLS